MRLARFLILVALMTTACTDDVPEDAGAYDLEGEEVEEVDEVEEVEEVEEDWPLPPRLSTDWAEVRAVVVRAPAVVTAGAEVDVVVELRNQTKDALSLDPCPVWVASVRGENSSLAPTLSGLLPCDQLGNIEPGQQVPLEITLPAPSEVDCHDGYDPDFVWELLDGEEALIDVRVNIPMRESDSAAPNDCGGRAGTTTPPPDLERT